MRRGSHWAPSPSLRCPHSPPACSRPGTASRRRSRRGDPVRGEYVLRLGGCVTCHTDEKNRGAFLAGGRAWPPYGTFYTSNITPDPATGIGGWSTADFVRAMTEGVSPDGHPYFPAFPYTPTPRCASTIWSISRRISTPSSRSPTPCRTMTCAFLSAFARCSGLAAAVLREGHRPAPDPARPDASEPRRLHCERPGHCAECHTPRNALGGRCDRFLARAPATGRTANRCRTSRCIQRTASAAGPRPMSPSALKTSILPDGDVLGGAMAEVDDATSHWTDQDREAVAEYLFTVVAPLEDACRRRPSRSPHREG